MQRYNDSLRIQNIPIFFPFLYIFLGLNGFFKKKATFANYLRKSIV